MGTLLFLAQFFLGAHAQQPANVSLPLMQLRVNSPFGMRIHPVTGQADLHKGVDLAARCEPVLSIMDGIVNETGFNRFLGSYIRIAHGDSRVYMGTFHKSW